MLTLAQIAAVIAAQRRLRDRFLFALLAETGMRVFVNLWAAEIGAPLRYGAPDALGRRTRARVGFDFHPHMFRHTFVTIARRHGMPSDVISKAVGHACVQTTADIYSHLDAEDLRRELAAAGTLDRLGDLV